jgi:hypothetical protein
VHQLFIATSLQLLLPVIQTIFFRCRDFQSAKLNVIFLDQNRRNYRLYGIVFANNLDVLFSLSNLLCCAVLGAVASAKAASVANTEEFCCSEESDDSASKKNNMMYTTHSLLEYMHEKFNMIKICSISTFSFV